MNGDIHEGWVALGTHAGPRYCTYAGPLEFSEAHEEDGLPRWERHDGCTAVTGRVPSDVDENGCYTLPTGECVSEGPCIHTPQTALAREPS